MAEEPIRPASDLEIAKIGAWNCDCSTKGPNHIWSCLMNFGPRLIARIEADAATIREQAATIASEKAIADRADELWRQTEAALLERLKAHNATGFRLLQEACGKRNAVMSETAELRARCERYEEALTLTYCPEASPKDCHRYCLERYAHEEARAIRARREAGKP